MDEPEDVLVIGEVPKNFDESIQVEICHWRGRTYVDIRVHTGAGKATGRGVTMRPAACEALLPLLVKALAEVKKE
ncbi:MAG: PC4/YdbC family ssDNA-binding protein [Candidatus Aminicenantales bacterium]|jgi:hypothetical protein